MVVAPSCQCAFVYRMIHQARSPSIFINLITNLIKFWFFKSFNDFMETTFSISWYCLYHNYFERWMTPGHRWRFRLLFFERESLPPLSGKLLSGFNIGSKIMRKITSKITYSRKGVCCRLKNRDFYLQNDIHSVVHTRNFENWTIIMIWWSL